MTETRISLGPLIRPFTVSAPIYCYLANVNEAVQKKNTGVSLFSLLSGYP